MKHITVLHSIVFGSIITWASCLLELRNEFIFNESVSYVSVGSTQATFFTKTNMNSNINKVTIFDLQTNISTLLTSTANLKSNRIKSPNNLNFKNTPTNNYYADDWANSSIFSNNLTSIYKNYNLSFSWTDTISGFGKSPDDYIITYNNITGYYSNIYINHSYISSYDLIGFKTLNLYHQVDKFIFIQTYSNPSNPQILFITVLTQSTTVINKYDRSYVDFNNVYIASAKLACSQFYIAVYYSNKIMTFKFDGKQFKPFKNITTTGTLYSIDITNQYIIASINNNIHKYLIQTGQLITTISTPGSVTNVTVSIIKSINKVILWKYGQNWTQIYSLTNQYLCLTTQGCNCSLSNCFDNDQKRCFFGSGEECPALPQAPQPVDPQSGNLEPQKINNEKLYCFDYSSGYCKSVCQKQCGSCISQPKQCSQCSDLYEKGENGECQLSFQNHLLIGIIAILSLFKLSSPQSMYCLFVFDGIQFYNFHKVQYEGVFSDALKYLDFIQDNVWSTIPSKSFIEFLDQTLPLTNYNAYTNVKFLEKRRNDSLFFQNTKKYFIISLPFSIFTFLIFNRLFWLLSKYKISLFLRIFSFWFQLGLMIATQNISLLNYYFLQNIQTLFSLNYETKVMNMIVLFLYGIFLIFCFVFLPLSLYFYKHLSVYFLNNCKIVPGIFVYSLLKYMFRPAMQGFIHIYLYDNQTLQLSLLALSALVFLCMSLLFEMFSNSFDNKFSFTFTCIVEFALSLLNLLLFAQIIFKDQLFKVIDQAIRNVMYLFFGCSTVLFIHPLVYKILSKIDSLINKCKKQKKTKLLDFSIKFFKTEKNKNKLKTKSIYWLKQSNKK